MDPTCHTHVAPLLHELCLLLIRFLCAIQTVAHLVCFCREDMLQVTSVKKSHLLGPRKCPYPGIKPILWIIYPEIRLPQLGALKIVSFPSDK
uniref:Secreted protein n=1 Tax=Laticauda laticaudata TaxID=8630 RepID=A0A8C5SAZ2_LATLA